MRENETDLSNPNRETEVRTDVVGGDILTMLADIHKRLTAIERDNAGVRAELEAAKNRGEVDVNLAQIRHVMDKYFPHDLPAPEVTAPPVARFDQYTGQPLKS